MPLWYRKKLNLTEREVKYAMSKTKSNAEAAAFLGISVPAYKTYAKLYKDPETGLSLYDLHKNQGGKGVKHYNASRWMKYAGLDGLQRILDGEYPEYTGVNLKARIIKEGVFPEECAYCGFSEKRITDLTCPLLLVWKDGNKRNHKKDNLELVCYNCYYLCYQDLKHKSQIKRLRLDDNFGEY